MRYWIQTLNFFFTILANVPTLMFSFGSGVFLWLFFFFFSQYKTVLQYTNFISFDETNLVGTTQKLSHVLQLLKDAESLGPTWSWSELWLSKLSKDSKYCGRGGKKGKGRKKRKGWELKREKRLEKREEEYTIESKWRERKGERRGGERGWMEGRKFTFSDNKYVRINQYL